jgi:ferredoxin
LCDGRELALAPGENLLDALLGAGVAVASSCKVGACQACLVKATRGAPPSSAQQGLKDAQRHQGYFLACQANLIDDLTISLTTAGELAIAALVVAVESLASDVVRVFLRPEKRLE